MQGHHRPTPAGRRNRARGQSLVELALILPVMLTMLGAAVDVARVYGAWIALEGATRDAAEQVAMLEGTSSTYAAASARAKTIVCTKMASFPGAVPGADPASCTQPVVTLTWSTPQTTGAGSVKNPLGSATVATSFPFRLLFAYPFITQGGAWTIGSNQTYTVVQNR